jgi:predicted secreted hydrolase
LVILLSVFTHAGKAQSEYPPLAGEVTLPQDEAPHQNSSEWWYFVGHLRGVNRSGEVRRYGFELVIFQERISSSGETPAVYVAHHAITDLDRATFDVEERTAEAPIPNQVDGFNLNVGQWTLAGGGGTYFLDADFADMNYGMHLELKTAEPPVLHGDKGIIPYGPYGTSAYYSYTALRAVGTIFDHGVPIPVAGISWQDHQWGNFNRVTAGWNWFSIQLDNRQQYMLYFIQDDTGAVVQALGTKVQDGVGTNIPSSDLQMTPLSVFTSAASGFTYPAKWQVTVPEGSFTITPILQNQELNVPGHRIYFEGDSEVVGILNGRPVRGVAYSEVNPYFEAETSLP